MTIIETTWARFWRLLGLRGASLVLAALSALSCASKEAAPQRPAEIPPAGEIASSTAMTSAAKVYMLSDISRDQLMAVYQALGRVSYLIKNPFQSVNAAIAECNTACAGRRASSAIHYQETADHSSTLLAPAAITSETSDRSIPAANGKRLTEAIVDSRFADYGFHTVLSHFKGHIMGGFGRALKNIPIGYGSKAEKSLIHTAEKSKTSVNIGNQNSFLESMVQAAASVVNAAGVDRGCDRSPAVPTMADISALGALDPVALDRACIDLVYAVPDRADLLERIESCKSIPAVNRATEISMGSPVCELVKVNADA